MGVVVYGLSMSVKSNSINQSIVAMIVAWIFLLMHLSVYLDTNIKICCRLEMMLCLNGKLDDPYSETFDIPSNLWYQTHQIPELKCFSSRLAVVFAQSIEARCYVENEEVVGAAPAGGAPTTSEWSAILFPTKMWFILEVWLYCVLKK